jgi:hypothetical protein
LQQREKTIKKLEHYQKKKSALSNAGEATAVREMSDVIEGLQQQVAFTQDNINDCQLSIMQMEENKVSR